MGLMDQLIATLYQPPKQDKSNTVLPNALTPAKAANLLQHTTVTQGQYLKGEVLDLRYNQILVLLENGATVSARTEGTLPLSIGQTARFFVAHTTEEQILLKLAKEETKAENPMVDKALAAAHITKTERSASLVTELLSLQQPVNETTLRHYLSLSAKYPELPVKNLILMELHHLPVTKENVEQFMTYQNQNAKLLVQTQHMLQELTTAIQKLPEGTLKQEIQQEFVALFGETGSETTKETTTLPSTPQNIRQPEHPEEAEYAAEEVLPVEEEYNLHKPSQAVQASHTPSTAQDSRMLQGAPAPQTGDSPDSVLAKAERILLSDRETLLPDALNSLLLKPEEVTDPGKIKDYYRKLNETLTKLEQLSKKISENTVDQNIGNTQKQLRQNLSFMEALNNIFPYVQLPLKFREAPAHGELYVYEKKKALTPSDTLSALLHLELEALGTMDIYVTLSGSHVTTRFSMTDKAAGDFLQEALPTLAEALADKGYLLQAEVSVQEPTAEEAPSLLEKFLNEQAPEGLNRYTFDIRA